MSKKSRRQRRLNLPPEAYNVPTSAPAQRPAATSPTAPATAAAPRATAPQRINQVNWQAEYGDVLGDLKRTGVLAVGIMAVMIVLSFIIR